MTTETTRTTMDTRGVFSDYLRAYAIAWGKANQFVSVGDIVTAQPGDWKAPAQVKITSIGCRLITLCHGRYDSAQSKWVGDGWQPELELWHCGRRLRKDGSLSQAGYGHARVLDRFTLPSGAEWEAPSAAWRRELPGGVSTFDCGALSWELERATPEQLEEWEATPS